MEKQAFLVIYLLTSMAQFVCLNKVCSVIWDLQEYLTHSSVSSSNGKRPKKDPLSRQEKCIKASETLGDDNFEETGQN